MDRDAIERRDFPIGRRGYDQAAVDEHLRRVADELESLRAPAAAPAPPLSAGMSEQVRLILEAAETSAAELRADAGRQASEHVANVQRAAGGMMDRLEELERELGNLLDALRASGERLNEGLARLHEQAGELGAAAAQAGDDATVARGDDLVAGGDDLVAGGDEIAPRAEAEVVGGDEIVPRAEAEAVGGDEVAPRPEAQVVGGDEVAAGGAATVDGDEAGARLIALNMALSGTPREDTARYLAENFSLADPDALLDDVYARAGQ